MQLIQRKIEDEESEEDEESGEEESQVGGGDFGEENKIRPNEK